jgi:DNA invertase Pin-like site-specific DNA recombinase
MTGTKPVGRHWTCAEEEQLRDMLDAGMTAAEVANEAGAHRQTIYARLQHLYRRRSGLRLPRG